MPTEEKMTIEERWKYLRMRKKRYARADRGERRRLLDEMEAVAGLHRKSLIPRLSDHLERQPRRGESGMGQRWTMPYGLSPKAWTSCTTISFSR